MRVVSFELSCLIALSLLTAFAACTPDSKPEWDLRNGTFHFYSPENEHFIILRDDSVHTEINAGTKDSSFWRVEWLDDSTYNTTFIRKTRPDTGMKQHFWLNVRGRVHITKVCPDYYLFESVVTYMDKMAKYNDTVWFQPK